MDEYLRLNRANWDERAPAHFASLDYAVDRFTAEPGYLSEVVRFDLPLLGDIRGLSGVHLQCHIGTDTISLERLGATMTGLDFSRPAIEMARHLAARTGAAATFVESEVYHALDVLPAGQFDLVFTGIGALPWLPSVRRWATVVAALLKPGGRLFIREGHPMLWSIDDTRTDDLLTVKFPYFERDEPTVWQEGGTYVSTDAVFEHVTTCEWNHGLGEILTALLDCGMSITALTEHDSVPWEALPGKMTRSPAGEWRLTTDPWRLPHSYTLQAVRQDQSVPSI
jgi:SAM-dependent methyltransferase